ncbi:hypothetical protein ACJJJB_09880 [Microbulbifer sp. ANSA001]|uniref:hypothetical protein n=1 Tax=Microbulbifer sp. ANSA001 TaxID=3243358 RepID=UPI004042AF04
MAISRREILMGRNIQMNNSAWLNSRIYKELGQKQEQKSYSFFFKGLPLLPPLL